MINRLVFSRHLFVCLMVLCLGMVLTAQASAKDSLAKSRLLPVEITLQEPGYVNLNERVVVTGRIIDVLGRPVAGKNILFEIDKQYAGQTRSDRNGNFEWKSKKNTVAGNYTVTAYSKESQYLDANSSSRMFTVLPANVWIETVPAISGITFELDGRQFKTNEYGYAVVQVYEAGEYRLEALIDLYENPSQRIEFGRWLEEAFDPYRYINVPDNDVIQVGILVYHNVGQTFVDLDGAEIDPQRIDEFSLRSDHGDYFTFTNGFPKWIPASRVTRRLTGLDETKLLYSLQDVIIDGSNVVNQSQQRFYSEPDANWPIYLLLYSIKISAYDAIFGNVVGESVNLEFPNGRVENFLLDENGEVEIHSLARGTYYVEIVGTNGLNYNTPVALSRNQTASFKIVTYVDLAVVGVAGLIVAVGLLLYGRPWIIKPSLKKVMVTRPELVEEVSIAATNGKVKDPDMVLAHSPEKISVKTPQIVQHADQNNGAEEVIGQAAVPEKLTTKQVETSSQIAIPKYWVRFMDVKFVDDQKFENYIGCTRHNFSEMVKILKDSVINNGRPTKLGLEDQLLVTIFLQKTMDKRSEIAKFFNISELTLNRYVSKVETALKDAKKLDLLSQTILSKFSSPQSQNKSQQQVGHRYR